MARIPIDPEGHALWRRVTETVRPLKGRAAKLPAQAGGTSKPRAAQPGVTQPASATLTPALSLKREGVKRSAPRVAPPANTLDGGWDKRLARGTVAPDMTIDLHGYTLAAAHGELEAGLTRAVAGQARLVLLVTGRPPPPGRSRLDNPLRGVIRASIGDWLHHSRHAGRIAAVRNAHPRHGGAGALYIILRRVRESA